VIVGGTSISLSLALLGSHFWAWPGHPSWSRDGDSRSTGSSLASSAWSRMSQQEYCLLLWYLLAETEWLVQHTQDRNGHLVGRAVPTHSCVPSFPLSLNFTALSILWHVLHPLRATSLKKLLLIKTAVITEAVAEGERRQALELSWILCTGRIWSPPEQRQTMSY
jgi:hypothetical protein